MKFKCREEVEVINGFFKGGKGRIVYTNTINFFGGREYLVDLEQGDERSSPSNQFGYFDTQWVKEEDLK